MAAVLKSETDFWLFDLDNALYPFQCNLFAEIDQKMTDFIEDRLKMPRAEARLLQKRLYREYGATMKGLQELRGIDPLEFMAFIHDVDYGLIAPNPILEDLIRRLPGVKAIFTNASIGHARKVLARLSVNPDIFAEIFDIEKADFEPKPNPAPYRALMSLLGAPSPARCVLIDDLPKNAKTAKDLGMKAVIIRNDDESNERDRQDADPDFIFNDISSFLKAVHGEN